MTRINEMATTPATRFAASTTTGFIVATDGTHESDGAVRVGLALARRDGMNAELVSVVEPLPLFETDGVPVPATDVDHLMSITRESREAALLAQRDRTHPGMHEWPFVVETGPRVESIVAFADRANAPLILLGLGEHGIAAWLRQRETALRVIRAAAKPVLALPRDAWGVPHSALVAIDFTASSEFAARSALDLLRGEGTLYVSHVTPRATIPQGDPRTWGEITTSAVIPRLEAVIRRLNPPPGIEIEYVLLHGDPAHELLAFAEERKIDMIAAGTHGRSALGRLMLGSVSTKLVRTASCWVLVAPPRPNAGRPDVTAAAPNGWT